MAKVPAWLDKAVAEITIPIYKWKFFIDAAAKLAAMAETMKRAYGHYAVAPGNWARGVATVALQSGVMVSGQP
jgi:hypothetical protein